VAIGIVEAEHLFRNVDGLQVVGHCRSPLVCLDPEYSPPSLLG
jgi:hypothetical protein